MSDLTIPKFGDTELEQPKHPFPEHIEPMDSEWWLSHKEKAVCDAYLGESFMDTKEAFKSQYTAKTKTSLATGASRFFKKAKVRRYLYFRIRKIEEKVELSQEQILRDMIDLKEMALGRKAQPIVLGHNEGIPIKTVAKTTDLKAANAVLTQLGKFHELGMWVEKKETDIQVVNFNFDMGKPEKVINNEWDTPHVSTRQY